MGDALTGTALAAALSDGTVLCLRPPAVSSLPSVSQQSNPGCDDFLLLAFRSTCSLSHGNFLYQRSSLASLKHRRPKWQNQRSEPKFKGCDRLGATHSTTMSRLG